MMEKETGDATERRRPLTEEEIEAIKDQLLNSIYADIGKSVIKKLLWVGGAVAVGALTALSALGHIKIGG
jgi:hypothetical protein